MESELCINVILDPQNMTGTDYCVLWHRDIILWFRGLIC